MNNNWNKFTGQKCDVEEFLLKGEGDHLSPEIAVDPCLVPHPYSHTDEPLAEPWSDSSLDPPLLASSIQMQIKEKTNSFLRHAIFKYDFTAHEVRNCSRKRRFADDVA